MSFGGMNPYPRKLGGGRPRIQDILDDLNNDRGDGFDARNTESIVYVNNMAIARAIAAAWGTNNRMGNMWVPTRMSYETLVRWEKIMAIYPPPNATVSQRRARVELNLSHFGQPTNSGRIYTLLSLALGEAFVAVEYIDISNAVIEVDDGSLPWGSVSLTTPWSSTVAHILVKTQKPAGWREVDFYNSVGKVSQVLDPILPTWTTFDWYRAGPTPVSVTGGPSGGGFFLDDEFNLDNQVFDE